MVRGSDRGMVTVELALALVSLMVATLAGAWLMWVLGQQIRLVDTAGEVARQLARGDRQAAESVAADRPAGSIVSSHAEGGVVVVEVRLRARPFASLPAIDLASRARVAAEPGASR